jgi:hypothetical protein
MLKFRVSRHNLLLSGEQKRIKPFHKCLLQFKRFLSLLVFLSSRNFKQKLHEFLALGVHFWQVLFYFVNAGGWTQVEQGVHDFTAAGLIEPAVELGRVEELVGEEEARFEDAGLDQFGQELVHQKA